MSIRQSITRQFSRPSGPMGHLVGWLMAIKNQARLRWGAEKLQAASGHSVLEIGFGPGSFIELLLTRYHHRGPIAGIDPSAVMLSQASRRNRRALADARLSLHQASVAAIPYPDAHFDRIFTSNTNMFWPDPVANLREVARVLRPGGQFCLLLQPYWVADEAGVRAEAEKIRGQMREAGFLHIESDFKAMSPVTCLAITAATV